MYSLNFDLCLGKNVFLGWAINFAVRSNKIILLLCFCLMPADNRFQSIMCLSNCTRILFFVIVIVLEATYCFLNLWYSLVLELDERMRDLKNELQSFEGEEYDESHKRKAVEALRRMENWNLFSDTHEVCDCSVPIIFMICLPFLHLRKEHASKFKFSSLFPIVFCFCF